VLQLTHLDGLLEMTSDADELLGES
jgi:hypothetical protein